MDVFLYISAQPTLDLQPIPTQLIQPQNKHLQKEEETQAVEIQLW